MSDWTSLGRASLALVSFDHLDRATRRLRDRSHVPISVAEARALSGSPLAIVPGERFILARAGIRVFHQLTIRDYVEHAEDRLTFLAEMSPDRRRLVIHTRQMSPAFPSRHVAVVARVPATVREVASRCLNVH